MKAIILDTETTNLNGVPIQIAHLPCEFSQGVVSISLDGVFDELFSADGEAINFAAMATHHIIEADLIGKPSYKTFQLPEGVQYIIGHNVAFDMEAIAKCGINMGMYRPICTLALSRLVFPEAPKHNLGTLVYMLSEDKAQARKSLKNAHNAKVDILNTAQLLQVLAQQLNATSFEHLYLLSQDAMIPKTISFGKHRGSAIDQLPIDYVHWLLAQDNLNPYLRIALERRAGKA